MKLTAPRFFTWFFAVLLGILGVLMVTGTVIIPGFKVSPFWIEAAACAILALGNLIPGM